MCIKGKFIRTTWQSGVRIPRGRLQRSIARENKIRELCRNDVERRMIGTRMLEGLGRACTN
uniref:Putative ovule protein n=1 Tax=Solanum chacoense TaxID=4108 RepID=A0A0V0HJH3_SOLCH